jgi:hypothetical protein
MFLTGRGAFVVLPEILKALGIVTGAEATAGVAKAEATPEVKPATAVATPALPGAFPAGAEAQTRAEQGQVMSSLQQSLAAMSSRPQGPEEIVLMSTLQMEEEVLATSVERVSRNRSASGFERVSIGDE